MTVNKGGERERETIIIERIIFAMGKFNEQQGFLLFLIFNRDSFLTGREKLRGFARRRSFQSREFFLDRSNLFDREISRKIKRLADPPSSSSFGRKKEIAARLRVGRDNEVASDVFRE